MVNKDNSIEITVKSKFYFETDAEKQEALNSVQAIEDIVTDDIRPIVYEKGKENKCDIVVTDKSKR
jgi:hypothetical protein